ncbi:MAG TPA: hypothetical protein PKD16_01365 [Saprospiraceae bacterium]|jgi:hypothetical protein|nr:hypothetical protein [Saprospiraceae bacterium]
MIPKLKGDFKICLNDKAITRYLSKESIESDTFCKDCKKITYSTKPLESTKTVTGDMLVFYKIKSIPLSKVEELINEYSVEEMAEKFIVGKLKMSSQAPGAMIGYIEGFKAHQELSKDKLFTIEDMKNCFHAGGMYCATEGKIYLRSNSFDEHIKSLLPKTEWDIEFANNKIQLV